MSNLNIESLNRITQSGDIEGLFRGTPEVRSPGTGGLSSGESPKTFSEVLQNSVETANIHQQQADVAIKELVAGRTKNIHETMLTIEKADTSLKLMMQVRNKIIDAYKEIMRMQV